MERRFVIREWNESDPNPGWTITEDEFIARWEKILYWLNNHQDLAESRLGFEQFLHILLHGDGGIARKEEGL